ncbi:MAG: methane monooxygenase/ammonia monooxygenase subunit B, partial [Rhizobiaceae bacterium]
MSIKYPSRGGSAWSGLCLAAVAVAAWAVILLITSHPSYAHGERNQEPFLRMRTTHFYDVTFSAPENAIINVNEDLTITGKFRLFTSWPASVAIPGKLYMNAATAGAAFVKKESWVNGASSIQSFDGEVGRDYEFKVVLQARIPGEWHVHPMVNVESAGGLLG